jgi:hypothetical protein
MNDMSSGHIKRFSISVSAPVNVDFVMNCATRVTGPRDNIEKARRDVWQRIDNSDLNRYKSFIDLQDLQRPVIHCSKLVIYHDYGRY